MAEDIEDIEEVKRIYKLTDEEHDKKLKDIMNILFYEKFPVIRPQAIIDIAPPASGKTGLNGYGHSKFIDDNVVIINSDELKPFHPKVDEIARLYPQFYTKVTDQESNSWTSAVFDRALSEGYNVIFEGTGRNSRIIETMRQKMQNHQIIVRALAVNDLNCLLSLIERYECQLETRGWGRLVTLEHFYETYTNMPNVIDEIEKSGLVDRVEIFKRGNLPTSPIKIYDSRDRENGRFGNAKYAINGGRLEDARSASKCFESRIKELVDINNRIGISDEERKIIEKIISLHEEIQKKNDIRSEEGR